MQICTATAATGISQRLNVPVVGEAETSVGLVAMTQAYPDYFFFPLVNHSAQLWGGKTKRVMIATNKNSTTKRKKRATAYSFGITSLLDSGAGGGQDGLVTSVACVTSFKASDQVYRPSSR